MTSQASAPLPPPLRAALIGLSASATTSWAANAHLPGLLAPAGQSKIAIKALLNSSVDAARFAVAKFDLPTDTKTYGDAEHLAADKDIDLVICSTRVDKHFSTILPSLRAGKAVFVEWPVAQSLSHIAQIEQAAQLSGARVAVGLQRRWNPVVQRVKRVIARGGADGDRDLGKILSVEARIYGGSIHRDTLPLGLKYFTQKDVGGNPIVIGVGHALDALLSVIGDLDPASIKATSQLQRPNVRIRDPATDTIVEEVISNVPDLLTFNAVLSEASPHAAPGATLTFFFRKGQPFPGTPALSWAINLEHGEIRVVSPTSTALEAESGNGPITIELHDYEKDKVEKIEWDWTESQKQLPLSARSVADTLLAFAEGKPPGEGWVGLADAVSRAKLIDRLLNA